MRAHHLPRASSERRPSPAGQHPPLRADLGAQDLGLGGGEGGEGGQQPESRWCPRTPARPGSATAGQQQCGGGVGVEVGEGDRESQDASSSGSPGRRGAGRRTEALCGRDTASPRGRGTRAAL